MNALPVLVQRLLDRLDVASERVAVLTFADDWRLISAVGALPRMGLDPADHPSLVVIFKDICVGLSRLRGTQIPQLGLPSGRCVDLHLLAEASLFHAVLIDVSESAEAARLAQQALQDAKLEAAARTRELTELRRRVGELKQLQLDLRRQLLVQEQSTLSVHAQLGGMQQEMLRELEQVVSRAATTSGVALPAHRALAAGQRLAGVLQQLKALPQLLRREALTVERVDLEQLAALSIDGANQLARERGLGFELRLNRRSELPTQLPVRILRPLLSAALNQALQRCSSGRVDAQLRWDGQTLKLEVNAPVAPYSVVERACLWEGQIEEGAPAAQAALFTLGVLLRCVVGRATVEDHPGPEQTLTVSITQSTPEGEVTGRLFSGGRIWLLSQDQALAALASERLADLGFEVETLNAASSVVEAAALHPPTGILIDMRLDDAVRLAFQIKSRGYSGRVIALGAAGESPAARASFDASVGTALEPDLLVRAIRGPGG